MANDVNKFFNNSDDYHTNKKLIGCRDLFRGVTVKEWAIGNHNISKLHVHNKVLVKSCVHLYHEFWKIRRIMLHKLEVQQKVLQEEVEVIMEETNKE